MPTADTQQIASAALLGLDRIFRPGFNYAKAGVMLMDLSYASTEQHEFDFGDHGVQKNRRQAKLMQALDALNDRFGRGTLRLGTASAPHRQARSAAATTASDWQMKQERCSPRYTTRWDELMVVT